MAKLISCTGYIAYLLTSESTWAVLLEQKRRTRVFVAARSDKAATAGYATYSLYS